MQPQTLDDPTGYEVLAEQFDDIVQQRESATLAMWTFLATEVLFFGGFLCGYAVYHHVYHHAWAVASLHLDVTLGAINTAVLIVSSFTMAMAVHSSAEHKTKQTTRYLVLTLLLGIAFLCIKGFEYHQKFLHHLVPGPNFRGDVETGTQLFFSFYFGLTGLHALHMIAGIIVVIGFLAFRKHRENPGRVEILGLYWHFVDIVWIFLFPLLYLIGRNAV